MLFIRGLLVFGDLGESFDLSILSFTDATCCFGSRRRLFEHFVGLGITAGLLLVYYFFFINLWVILLVLSFVTLDEETYHAPKSFLLILGFL